MDLFKRLWNQYTELTPSAAKIHQLFTAKGENILNDHIAIRTYNDPRINVEVLSQAFLNLGYEANGSYHFEQKKLNAVHFENPNDPSAPKIFISELLLENFSEDLQNTVKSCIDKIDPEDLKSEEILLKGRLWGDISFATYDKLRLESEYAAWLYVYGFCANHFTVNVNALKHFNNLEEVNRFLEQNGFTLNSSGGKIKGTPEQLLEQSSILGDMRETQFTDGLHKIPSCYYEFALRYPMENGELYQGFIASSADKIFESTDLKEQNK